MKRADIIASLLIGELAAILMVAIGRNITLPQALAEVLWVLLIVFPIFTFLAMVVGTFLGRRAAVAYQLSKFALVGGLNFLIDLGVLNLLIAATGISTGFWASVFKAISFCVAVVSSFLWNKFWTFQSLETDNAGRQFIGFFIVSATGLLINVALFTVINGLGPLAAIPAKSWPSVAAGSAAVLGLAWNFVGYKFFVFRR